MAGCGLLCASHWRLQRPSCRSGAGQPSRTWRPNPLCARGPQDAAGALAWHFSGLALSTGGGVTCSGSARALAGVGGGAGGARSGSSSPNAELEGSLDHVVNNCVPLPSMALPTAAAGPCTAATGGLDTGDDLYSFGGGNTQASQDEIDQYVQHVVEHEIESINQAVHAAFEQELEQVNQTVQDAVETALLDCSFDIKANVRPRRLLCFPAAVSACTGHSQQCRCWPNARLPACLLCIRRFPCWRPPAVRCALADAHDPPCRPALQFNTMIALTGVILYWRGIW